MLPNVLPGEIVLPGIGYGYAHGDEQVDEGGMLLAFQSVEPQRCLEVVSNQSSGPSGFRTIPSATSSWMTSAQAITLAPFEGVAHRAV